MKLTSHCPRCNAIQDFTRRQRQISPEKVQVYIQCNMCRWTKVLYTGTERHRSLKEDLDRLKGLGRAGRPVDSTIRRYLGRLRKERED